MIAYACEWLRHTLMWYGTSSHSFDLGIAARNQVMGVCGSGKTTFGEALAPELGLPFYDADNFHPLANVQKMSQGNPLSDDDRLPWLKILAVNIEAWAREGGAVLACSALKQGYREILGSQVAGNLVILYLDIPREVLLQRLAARQGHFMPSSLLDSQMSALQLPGSDERALAVFHLQPTVTGHQWRLLKGESHLLPVHLSDSAGSSSELSASCSLDPPTTRPNPAVLSTSISRM